MSFRRIKDLAPKPSDAVKAMIDGLLEFSMLPGFVIDMSTFGQSYQGVCFGCAATCAIYKLAGHTPTEDPIALGRSGQRLAFLQIDNTWVWGVDFEGMIDFFRRGDIQHLFRYYEVEIPEFVKSDEKLNGEHPTFPWSLKDDNWREELPKVREFYEKLVAAGL